MVVVSMLPHAEIGGNDHREDAPQFSFCIKYISGLIITSVVAFLNTVGYWNNWMVYIVSFVGCSTLSRFEDLRQRGSR